MPAPAGRTAVELTSINVPRCAVPRGPVPGHRPPGQVHGQVAAPPYSPRAMAPQNRRRKCCSISPRQAKAAVGLNPCWTRARRRPRGCMRRFAARRRGRVAACTVQGKPPRFRSPIGEPALLQQPTGYNASGIYYPPSRSARCRSARGLPRPGLGGSPGRPRLREPSSRPGERRPSRAWAPREVKCSVVFRRSPAV